MSHFFGKSCWTNSRDEEAVSPNPDVWTLNKWTEYSNACVMKLTYPGCTNYEGMKIIVMPGKVRKSGTLDPHFSEGVDSPIARFPPTDEGWMRACTLARSIQEKPSELKVKQNLY